MPAGGSISVSASHDYDAGDVDLRLWDFWNPGQVGSASTASDVETVSWTATAESDVVVEVALVSESDGVPGTTVELSIVVTP